MATKQLPGRSSPDGSCYVCFTDGSGNLVTVTTTGGAGTKPLGRGEFAPDNSQYITVTDGNNNLK